MGDTIRVFALLSDAELRRQAQRKWHSNGITLVGLHTEGGNAQLEDIARMRPHLVLVDAEVDGAREVVETAARQHRIPVLALVRTQQGPRATMQPLEWGAVDLVPLDGCCEGVIEALEPAIHALRDAQVVDQLASTFPLSGAFPDASVFDLRRAMQGRDLHEKLVVVGGGAGGPMAMRRILRELRGQRVSPIVYVSNLAASLHPVLAPWLEEESGLVVVEAAAHQTLEVGHLYVVGADRDGRIERDDADRPTLHVEAATSAGKTLDSVLQSAATAYGPAAVGVVLTGRGQDGRDGLLALRRAGGFTIAQDRVSSVLHEAPGAARDAGGAIECLPINEIAERISMLMRPEPASQS